MITNKNPKYKITDTVYFMQNNLICDGEIYEIETITNSLWDMQLHHHNDDKCLRYNHRYKICTDSFNKIGTGFLPESQVFETKEDLIKELTK